MRRCPVYTFATTAQIIYSDEYAMFRNTGQILLSWHVRNSSDALLVTSRSGVARRQVDHCCRGESAGDDLSGQVEPLLAVVEDDAVAGGYDGIGFFQLGIGAYGELNFPIPAVFFGQFPDQCFQSAAVGDGAV